MNLLFQVIQNLKESTKKHLDKIRLMNKKMIGNEHSTVQIKAKSRELENELKTNQLAFNRMKSTLVGVKQKLLHVKEERLNIQNEIKIEKEIVQEQKKFAQRDYFTKMSGNSQKDFKTFEEKVPAKMVDQLRKQLSEKQSVLTAIEPVVSRLNKKIIFSSTKRRQRKKLNTLSNQLSRDISHLQNALDWIAKKQ